MKICPACDRTYHDDELNFCLMCGVGLAEGAAQPTVIIRSDSEPTVVISAERGPTSVLQPDRPTIAENREKSHGIGFWIAVTLACVVGVSGATLGIFFLYFLLTGNGGQPSNGSQGRKAPITAKTPAKQTPTPNSTPIDEPATPTPAKEIISNQIGWSTTAVAFADEVFGRVSFYCPPDGTESTVFGSDIYAANSSICTAAVHAGKITFQQGGPVTIIFGPGLSSYVTTTRNGITTNMFGDEDTSFVFE